MKRQPGPANVSTKGQHIIYIYINGQDIDERSTYISTVKSIYQHERSTYESAGGTDVALITKATTSVMFVTVRKVSSTHEMATNPSKHGQRIY